VVDSEFALVVLLTFLNADDNDTSRNIRKGDEITLTALDGSFRYRVDFTEVVNPDNVSVLDDSADAILTLVTCYPFYFVGPAPKRFVVRAHRIPG
jgi:sortase A